MRAQGAQEYIMPLPLFIKKKSKMKKLYSFILLFSVLISLSNCDTQGDIISTGYHRFGGVKVIWQADNTINYKFTLDNDSIYGIMPFSIDKTTGMLRAFRDNETTPELETEVAINGKEVELIQMPGSSISIKEAEPTNDSDLPSDERNKFKLRFYYNNVEGWQNTVKLDLYYKVDLFTPMMDAYPTGISVNLQNGILSDYIIVDLNILSPNPSNSSSPLLLAVISGENGNIVFDGHKEFIPTGQIKYSYTISPEYSQETKNWTYDIKYVTCSYDQSLKTFSYSWGDAWE